MKPICLGPRWFVLIWQPSGSGILPPKDAPGFILGNSASFRLFRNQTRGRLSTV